MHAFNLLHYPDLATQRRRWHMRWTASAGLAAGLVLAWWLTGWLHAASQQVQQARSLLQVQITDHQRQQKNHQKMQELQQKRLLESAHLAHLERQHQTWLAVYQALQKETGPDSVQLLRLQLDANTLELQGKARDALGMDKAHQALTLSLAPHLQPVLLLSSWLVKPATHSAKAAMAQADVQRVPSPSGLDDGLEFVWQSGWPDGSASAQRERADPPGPSNEQGRP